MPGDKLVIKPSPPGFLNRKQFEDELTRAVRRVMKDSPESLEKQESRQRIAEKVICEMLAIDEDSNLVDIEYLAEHMSGDKSGIIRDIMNRNHAPEAVARMDSIYGEMRAFEESHRDETIVPRASSGAAPEA